MWASDKATPHDQALYGTHAVYVASRARTGGASFGAFLANSNAVEARIEGSTIKWRGVGGVLDFFVYTGPQPEDVVRQHQFDVVGKPLQPPAWALGVHQCRWGYKSLQDLREVVNQFKKHSLPLETLWNDLDYMEDKKVFTNDPTYYGTDDYKSFVQDLHDNGMRYTVLHDPGIAPDAGYYPYDWGQEAGIWIRDSDGNALIGNVWPGDTVFPDYSADAAAAWWAKCIAKFHDDVVPLDGYWIDMNEPASFYDGQKGGAPDSPLNNPPWVPENTQPLYYHTVSLDATDVAGRTMYDVKQLYGFYMGRATLEALWQLHGEDTRQMIISRSTFAGSGRHNQHWLGDNWSTWDSLQMSIPGQLNFNLFGIPFVGVDVCGFLQNTTSELCGRWYEASYLSAFFRNHNTWDSDPQEPYVLGDATLAVARRHTVRRMALLPYLETAIWKASNTGVPFWSPLPFRFPESAADT